MNRRTGLLPWLPVLGVGMLGVVAGHSLTYLLAVPALVRTNLLAATGHAYWANAVSAALLAGLAAGGGLAIRSFRAGRQGQRRRPFSYPEAAWRLGVVQVLAFVALEVCERALAGVPLGSMFQDHILPVGVAVQLAVALIGALGLVLLARAAHSLGSRLSRARRTQRRPCTQAPVSSYRPCARFTHDPSCPRGPPLPIGSFL